MRIQIIFFLLFAEAILLFGHALVYFHIAKMFPAFSSSHRLPLLSVLFFLSISFFIASALAHLSGAAPFRMAYLLAGWWLGFLVNLILAACVAWILSSLAHLFSLSIGYREIGFACTALALVVSVYGAWNAFHPKVKEVSVEIPGLPEAWQGKRVVQLSDVHLGNVYRADFLRAVVDQVNAIRPEAVFITGDLFDGMDGALGVFAAPLRDLRSTYGTFFITGNHETYLGLDEAFASIAGTGIRVLDGQVVDLDGLKVAGIGYPPQGTAEDVTDELAKLEPQFAHHPTILLHHAPTHVAEFAASGVSLQLSGHTHKGQQYPFGLITALIYHGFDYGLRTIGDFSIYTTNGVGTWGPAMRVGNTPEIVVLTLQKKSISGGAGAE